MKKTLKIVLVVAIVILATSLIGVSNFASATIKAPFTSDYTI